MITIFRTTLEYVSGYFRPHLRGPVKRLFSAGLMAALGLSLVAAVSTSSDGSRLIIEVDDETVVVGERFFIDILVDADDPVNAVDVVLEYPEDRLEITELRKGESVITLWAEEPQVEGDLITLSGGTFRRGFSGEHRIMRIAARALRPGVIRITPQDVQLLAGDGSGDDVLTDGRSLDSLRLYAVSADEAERGAAVLPVPTDGVYTTDLTGDGRITMQDISIFMSAWNNQSPIYDFTGDGRMTFRDFSVLLADFFRRR